MRYALLFIVIVVFSCFQASATIIDIPDDYPTIQQGIDVSTDGDTVLVQPGTYVENINFNGHNIVLGSLFLTTGDTTYIAETVIDGNSSAPVVMFAEGEDSTTFLMGFSIVNAFTNQRGGGMKFSNGSNPIISNNIIARNMAIQGAGLYIEESSPVIRNNYFWADTSWHDGGAIYSSFSSSPEIVGNLFEANFADCGAAACCGGSDAVISFNIMRGNFASYRGGAIACLYGAEPTILNNIMENNSADWGGAVFSSNGDIIFKNNIVVHNAANGGGGLYIGGGYESVISQNLFFANLAFGTGWQNGTGGAISCYSSNVTITNSILWADSATVAGDEIYVYESNPVFAFCNIEGGWDGEGNIDIDPLFRDPENDDFHLMATACGDPHDSPCIDAGDPSIEDFILDCSWGLGELRSDIGAYGGGDSVTVDIDDPVDDLPIQFILLQNYPNPFNPTTSISYSLPEQSDVRIEVYNILGQSVATLIDGNQQTGIHSITWQADDYPSGVYFARLEAGTRSEIIKMVLLK